MLIYNKPDNCYDSYARHQNEVGEPVSRVLFCMSSSISYARYHAHLASNPRVYAETATLIFGLAPGGVCNA